MMSPSEKHLEELILRHLEGDLSPSEFREFEEEIVRNPDAPRLLRAGASDALLLAKVMGKAPPALKTRERRRWLLTAAALLLAALVTWALWPTGPAAPQYEGSELFALRTGGKIVPEDTVVPGHLYLARSGTVRAGPVALQIQAPTIFTAAPVKHESSTEEISLAAGCVRVEATGKQRGFRLRTPKGIFSDIPSAPTRLEIQLNNRMEEEEMISKVQAGSLPIFVLATVLMGQVSWTPAKGAKKALTPEMGPVRLADDFSLGRVSERQGLVLLKPVLGERWTLATREMPLRPGDWIRGAVRGANAAELRLTDGTRVILGPGSLLELVKAGELKLHQGEVEVLPAKETTLRAEGPQGSLRTVTGPEIIRVEDEALEVLEKEPAWLVGFKAEETTEALGSLLARVDGRDVPLTIGYHKATVDIRDQIALTVIEESFVNHTDAVLEGVFYFPLPQEASISGFAMWIHGELVEADIVEKQRAREIYEEILREKRDPGLLEWTGGNIFKARVYPIPAQGEKRIRITYTQVLPKSGNAYRYSYALRSEMLQQNPLRELQVDVKISSAESLQSVSCPSHAARIHKTAHAAQVEFAAQEYTPRRDFEVVVETASAQGSSSAQSVVVIPHLRDKDGYFMVLLSAKGEGAPGEANRRLVRTTEPLDIILMADTSASMTVAQLEEQRLFISSLLGSLSEKDTFNLMAFDVTSQWLFETPTPVTPESTESALALIDGRGALGWTDLDRAFEEVLSRVRTKTHVIYVGDGIPTLGDADPAAFAARLQKMYRGEGKFHAVGVGNTCELVVLKAIASLGAGSLQRTGGGKDGLGVASSLLEEITSPGLRDIELEYKGIQVARVYPETLPNLPAGRQQIILGRYLPEGKDTRGSLRVTGSLRGERVSSEVPIVLANADQGNSFIPRFWARLHLEYLLSQGSNPQVQQKVIALSEDYQIITPYTSFLVLESDADRERFQVKKRLRMRGGEEFFARGREDANYAILKQQVQQARLWRQGLREQVLRLYSGLGRDVGRPPDRWPTSLVSFYTSADIWRATREDNGATQWFAPQCDNFNGDGDLDLVSGGTRFSVMEATFAPPTPQEFSLQMGEVLGTTINAPIFPGNTLSVDGVTSYLTSCFGPSDAPDIREKYRQTLLGQGITASPPAHPLRFLFPRPRGAPRAEELGPRWPKDVRNLLEKLNRRGALAALPGGLRIAVESNGFDTRSRPRPGARSTHVISPEAWTSSSRSYPGDIATVRWCRRGERGALDAARLLGSRRKAEEGDARGYAAPLAYIFDDLETTHRAYIPALSRDGQRATLKLIARNDPRREVHVVVDLARSAILEVARFHRGKKTSTQVFGDFVELAGAFWPQSLESRDGNDRVTRKTTIRYEELSKEDVTKAIDDVLEPLETAILLDLPLPELQDAKRRVAGGQGTLDDRWVLLGHFAASQEWDRVRQHHKAIEDLTAGKPGQDAIRLQLLMTLRRNEEARELAYRLAGRLAANAATSDFGLSQALRNRTRGILQHIERLELLQILKPVFERQDPKLQALKTWGRLKLESLRNLRRVEETQQLTRQLARSYPTDAGLQRDYADSLRAQGEIDAAIAFLDASIEKHGPWPEDELESLKARAAGLLWDSRRLEEFLRYVDAWVASRPETCSSHIFDQYLSALVLLDRESDADTRIAAWLQHGLGLDSDRLETSRLDAAITHALDRGNGLGHLDRPISGRWRAPLSRVVRSLWRNEERWGVAELLLRSGRFTSTEEGKAVRIELYGRLVEEVETLDPQIVRNLFDWLRGRGFRPADNRTTWEDLLQKIFQRWERERSPAEKWILEHTILAHASRELKLDLRRRQLAQTEGPEEQAEAAGRLFEELLGMSWSDAVEKELVGLLPQIGWGKEKQATQVLVLRRILRHAEQKLTTRKLEELLELTRRLESLKLHATVMPFVKIERLTVEARLERDPGRLFEELKSLVLEIPEPDAEEPLDGARSILAERCFLILGHLATRPGADAALSENLFETLDALIAKDAKRPDARTHKYRLLVALDEGEKLEALLTTWAQEAGDVPANPWKIPLGYLLAELGKLSEAICVFESVEKIDELSPAEYNALAGWYLAVREENSREKSREAKLKAFEKAPDWQLAQSLQHSLARYRREGQGVPEELDADVLLQLTALLRKTTHPQNHTDLLKQYYEATRDFRLLEALPEAVLGQSAGKIYPFLESLGPLLSLIGDEATVDRVVTHLRTVSERAQTQVDRRALSLLEFLVENRAAAQANGAGPHLEAAIKALRAAFKDAWTQGEPVLMARFLSSTADLVEELRKEQLSQLESLHEGAPSSTEERLRIATDRASALWNSQRKEQAIQVLSGELGAYREAHGGLLPPGARGALGRYASYLESSGEFLASERLWRRELELSPNEMERRRRELSLFATLSRALREDARTSLGEGPELYRELQREILEALRRRTVDSHAQSLVSRLCQVFEVANSKKYEGVNADLTRFAYQELPQVLHRYQYRGGQTMVGTVADRIRRNLGTPGWKACLEFLVTRAETEPQCLERQGYDFWGAHGPRTAEAKSHARRVGSLEPRLLAIVQKEIRRDMTYHSSRNRRGYSLRSAYFWAEKADTFFETALSVLEEHRSSEAHVRHIAKYFFRGLGRQTAAIDALLKLYQKEDLSVDGRWQLAQYLLESKEHAECVPVLVALVKERPGKLEFRTALMRATFGSRQKEKLASALQDAHEYFHAEKRWGEPAAAALGKACLDTQLFEQAVKYLGEAIALQTKTGPNRGIGTGVLSAYYSQLASAHSGLEQDAKAINAAAAAVVSWGPRKKDRERAWNSLLETLKKVKDLDAMVEKTEKQLDEDGVENPTLRKALGQVYLERRQFAEAARHFEAAVESGPVDADTSRNLLKALDAAGSTEEATARLLALARARRHDFSLYEELGRRYAAAKNKVASERAFTSLAELSANESEGRELLARVREEQERFTEAATEWQQVIRIRSKEPAGYLGRAWALIRAGRREEAAKVLDVLRRESWPQRFGDILEEVRTLEAMRS